MAQEQKQEEQNSKKVHIQPIVVRTDNVAKELMRISAGYKIHVSELDFLLLSVQTFSKHNIDENEDWVEMTTDEVRDLKNDDELINEMFELRQTYEIEITSDIAPSPLDEMDVAIGANANLTKVYLTIKPGSQVSYYDDFKKDFINLINKRKLRANLMINIFDDVMGDSVDRLHSKLLVNGTMRFDKKEILQVAQGVEPVATLDDRLILHYEKKQKQMQEGDKVDYSKRGFLISVVKGEVIIEYIKPKEGKPGRNCRGEYLKPPEPKAQNEPTFAVTENIEVVETDEAILYKAKDNGYITYENNTYDIKKEVDVAEISFKTTGSIETDMDADVSINVKEKDTLKDAVGMGMEVEVKEIYVEGNVGPNAKVRAVKATIEGQTHKSSFVMADKLDINIHKGRAEGHEIDITRLEHGHVAGDSVHIKQAIGGEIRAREITIETLGSHVTLIASERITIEKLQGGENKFIIDPTISSRCKDFIEENEKLLEKAREQYNEIKREVERYEEMIEKNEQTYLDIKKKLMHYKRNGIKLPNAFVKKYKVFQSYYTRLEALKMELRQQQDKIELLEAKYTSSQNSIFDARIVNNDRWRNHNEIVFKLVEPPMEVRFVPEHNSVIKALGLKESEDDYYIAEVEA